MAQAGKKLTVAQSASMLSDAHAIGAKIGCR